MEEDVSDIGEVFQQMSDAAERAPFDPGDAMDAMSERFRTQVTEIALAAHKVTIYRDMDPKQQLECFIAGALTGLVGVCLASIKSEGADAMMEYLAECLSHAREFAETIKNPDGTNVINRHDR
jgi:hypothetical protein